MKTPIKFKQMYNAFGSFICALSEDWYLYMYDVKKDEWKMWEFEKPKVVKIKGGLWKLVKEDEK